MLACTVFAHLSIQLLANNNNKNNSNGIDSNTNDIDSSSSEIVQAQSIQSTAQFIKISFLALIFCGSILGNE